MEADDSLALVSFPAERRASLTGDDTKY